MANSNDKELEANELGSTSSTTSSSEKKELNKANTKLEIVSWDSKTGKSYSRYLKKRESYLDYLRQYLKEDKTIIASTALRRLYDEADLGVSYITVQRGLRTLRKEMGLEYTNLDLCTSEPSIGYRQWNPELKLKELHLEHIRNYFIEDNTIGPSEIMRRLHKEAGLDVSHSTVQKILKNLKTKIGPEYSNLNSSIPSSKARFMPSNYESMQKDSRIDCPKENSRENRPRKRKKSKDQLQKEAEPDLSTKTTANCEIKQNKEIGSEYGILSLSKFTNTPIDDRSKLKDSHLETLKRYLEKDSDIVSTKAKRLLREETGLKVSDSTIRRTLRRIREEKDSGYSFLDSSDSGSSDKNMPPNHGNKINDLNCERSKENSNVECYMKDTKAADQLQKGNNLNPSTDSARKYSLRPRKETSSKPTTLNTPTTKKTQPIDSSKINNFHIENLKEYLDKDTYITTGEDNATLEKQINLEASTLTVQRSLKLLKVEMDSDYDSSDSIDANNSSKCDKNLKDIHINPQMNHLKENNSSEPAEVTAKLEKDNGLDLNAKTIRKFLFDTKKEIDPIYINLDSSNIESAQYRGRYKLKDPHLELLKKYLKDDISISPTKAMRLLREETGLNVSAETVKSALLRLKKVINQDNSSLASQIIEPKVNSSWYTDYGLKKHHIDLFKYYLMENRYIKPSEAKKKFQKEAGLEVSLTVINMVLKGIREKMGSK